MEQPPREGKLNKDEVSQLVLKLAGTDPDMASVDLDALAALTGRSPSSLRSLLREIREERERAEINATLERLEKASYTSPPRYFVRAGHFRAARNPRLEAYVLMGVFALASCFFLWLSIDQLRFH